MWHATGGKDYNRLTVRARKEFRYLIEVYMDNYISLAIATAKDQLNRVATAVMTGIHDVFPLDTENSEDDISLKN